MQTTFEDAATTNPDSKTDREERLLNPVPKQSEVKATNVIELKTAELTVDELTANAINHATSAIGTATTIEGIGLARQAALNARAIEAATAPEATPVTREMLVGVSKPLGPNLIIMRITLQDVRKREVSLS